jgi:hypothetical protein
VEKKSQHQSEDQSGRWRVAGYENHDGRQLTVIARWENGREVLYLVTESGLRRKIDNSGREKGSIG